MSPRSAYSPSRNVSEGSSGPLLSTSDALEAVHVSSERLDIIQGGAQHARHADRQHSVQRGAQRQPAVQPRAAGGAIVDLRQDGLSRGPI